MRARFVLRVRILMALAVLAAALLFVRLYFIQIIHGDEYRDAAAGQYVENAADTPDRGDIFFTRANGERVAAAVMQGGWRLAINPHDIGDSESVLAQLASAIEIDEQRFRSSAAKKEDPYEEVAFRITDAEADVIRALKLPGVQLVRDEWRFYPAGELAAHAIGFVAYKGDTKAGVYGLERYWEDTLTRNTGGLYINPFAEIFTNLGAIISSDPGRHDGSIITSLEPAVTEQLEKELDVIMEKYSPRQAGGVVMDPKTGEIIALSRRPAFNPNTYNVVEDQSVFQNPVVESVFEMGSIIKPLTVAAAIDAGAITPKTQYDDKGFVKLSGETIRNFDGKARGRVDMQEVLSQSLNVGIAFIVGRVGNTRLGEYFESFKLGEETGIDLPGEVAGRLGAIQDGYDVDYASAGFGQGIAMTPIATIRALSILANQGKLPEPHVVRAIRYESGVERNLSQATQQQVIKPETAATVTTMLVNVYDDALLQGELKMEHYSIAAKTGTAQMANSNGGGYYDDRYLHSFFGYFPAHDPKFIVLLYAVEPVGEQYASRTLSHPFYNLAKFLINYHSIPPDR